MFESRSKKGFTLAEVLITLLIIGVIASIVIPALIGDTAQMEFKVSLKKAAASLNQALTMSIAQDATDLTSVSGVANVFGVFANKLNIVSSDSANSILTTADGMTYKFYTYSTTSKCDNSTIATANADSIVGITGYANCYVLVDVNGAKKPNRESNGGIFKDQYYLVIRDKTVIPAKTGTANGEDLAQQAIWK